MIIRALSRCHFHRNALYYVPKPRTLFCSPRKICVRDAKHRAYSTTPRNAATKVVNVLRNNISGYTRVLIVVMGIMCIVVIVAEQTIAKNTIILNVLPPKPHHEVYRFPLSVFQSIRTKKQLVQAETELINISGPKGCGKSEYVRQYCELFLKEGPHLYYKIHKLSNRRNCQVFVIDARNKQTLAHSLISLNNKLRQTKAEEGPDENYRLIQGIKTGLQKQSRWLLVFEDADPALNLPELLKGYKEWGDGQIIITSVEPISSCHNIALSALIPRITAEKAFFSIAPTNDVFEPSLLDKLFGGDLRSVVAAANCIKLEQQNGNDFSFENLYEILSKSLNPKEDVLKLYCGLLAFEHPKLLLAIDFIGKLPLNVPIPYKYIKHHMDTNIYDLWMEALYDYTQYRHSKTPKRTPEPVVETIEENVPIDPENLAFFARYRHICLVYLGLDPHKDLRPQLEEVSEIIWPKPIVPPDDQELTLLQKCCFLKYEPEYGGHVPVFNLDEDIQAILKSIHTEFTAPLLEGAIVLEQDQRYRRTWLSKFWSFTQAEHTAKSRVAILGKAKVHQDPKNSSVEDLYPNSSAVYDSLLVYKAGPISHANLSEYNDLLTKQTLRSVMSFVDVTIPNTVKGTLESIILHGHLTALSADLPAVFDGLAETCSLHLKAELGSDNLEEEFLSALTKAKSEDPKGPSHASALHRYACWLHKNSRDTEAKELLDEAVKFADSLALNRTVAQVCCELDDLEMAEKHLELALQLVKPGDQEVLGPLLTDLGQIKLLQGKTGVGIKYLQGAIEGYKNQIGTESPEYARALNVVSIGHLLLGDAARSNRARGEASSVLAKLKKKKMLSESL